MAAKAIQRCWRAHHERLAAAEREVPPFPTLPVDILHPLLTTLHTHQDGGGDDLPCVGCAPSSEGSRCRAARAGEDGGGDGASARVPAEAGAGDGCKT